MAKAIKFLNMAAYIVLAILLLWLAIASTRIYVFTKNTEKLINHLEPYQQKGDRVTSILFVGDSFGYGTGAGSASSTLAGLMGRHMPSADIVNKSKNGTKSIDLANRINSDVDRNYDVIVVVVGANDILHPEVNVSSSRQFYKTIYDTVSRRANNVIAITTVDFKDISFFLWPLNYYFSERSSRINQIAKDEASKYSNITYIDAFDQRLYPSDPKIFESEDRLHPNDLGTHYWFHKILEKTNGLTFSRS